MAIQSQEPLSLTYFYRSFHCQFGIDSLDMYLEKYVYLESVALFDGDCGSFGPLNHFELVLNLHHPDEQRLEIKQYLGQPRCNSIVLSLIVILIQFS